MHVLQFLCVPVNHFTAFNVIKLLQSFFLFLKMLLWQSTTTRRFLGSKDNEDCSPHKGKGAQRSGSLTAAQNRLHCECQDTKILLEQIGRRNNDQCSAYISEVIACTRVCSPPVISCHVPMSRTRQGNWLARMSNEGMSVIYWPFGIGHVHDCPPLICQLWQWSLKVAVIMRQAWLSHSILFTKSAFCRSSDLLRSIPSIEQKKTQTKVNCLEPCKKKDFSCSRATILKGFQ